MIVFEILGAVVIVIVAVMMFSQVIIPAAKGQLLFPFFRNSSELDDRLLELGQMKDDLEKVDLIRQASEEIAEHQPVDTTDNISTTTPTKE